MKRTMKLDKRGQTTLAEYVLILFVVIAFAVAITVYAQRALQARVYDARNYAINLANSECFKDCQEAIPGQRITREYEPYYGQIESNTDRRHMDSSSIQGGVAKIEGVYKKIINEETSTTTESRQRPPKDAN